MSFRDDMRAVADTLRALAGPGQFDIRVDKLTIIKRVWDGGRRGIGSYTDSVWADIPQIYGMKHVTVQEIENSGGRFEQGDIRVGPITPAYNTGQVAGGWSDTILHPSSTDNGTEYVFNLYGEHSGNYRLQGALTLKPFSYYVVIRRDESSPAINLPENSTLT
jgi:hypothetical protein